eukprot:430661-Amphidinium_carterae.1
MPNPPSLGPVDTCTPLPQLERRKSVEIMRGRWCGEAFNRAGSLEKNKHFSDTSQFFREARLRLV